MAAPNNRHDPRVRKPVIIRFKDPLNPMGGWEVVTSLNISRSGMCFLTMNPYGVGSELRLKMTSVELDKEIQFNSRVVRSQPSKKARLFHETAVTFEAIDPPGREVFDRIIDVAMEREQTK